MSQSEAELTLLINAKNLAANVVKDFGKSLDGVGKAASTMGSKVGAGIQSVKTGITGGLGNLTETLAQGGGLGEAAFAFGAFMAGQAVESLLENLLEKLAESTVIEVIGGALGSIGSTLGSILSSAIAIGAAAFPVVLVGLIIAAIVYLINNPDVAKKILDFAGGMVDFIVKGVGKLPQMLFDAIRAAVQFVVDNIGPTVQKIVDFFLGIPGKIIGLGASIVSTIIGGMWDLGNKVSDTIRKAFEGLSIQVGPFRISGKGISVDLGSIHFDNVPVGIPGLGFFGGGARAPSSTGGGGTGAGGLMSHGHDIIMDSRKVAEAVDDRMAQALRRAASTTARV